MEEAQDFQPRLSPFIRSEAAKAAEGIESYFAAPWEREGWIKVLFQLIYGESMEMEKVQDAVCSSFFGFETKR